MFYIEKSQYIAECILLSLQCFEFVLSITTEAAQKLDDEGDGSYAEDKNFLISNIFTTNRYMWNLTVPTHQPPSYSGPGRRRTFLSWVVWALLLLAVVLFIVRHCLKHPPSKNCCSLGFRSHVTPSSNEFSTVQSSQESPGITEELQRPPIRNQVPEASSEISGRPDLFNQVGNNGTEATVVGMANLFMNSNIESPSQERGETENTIERNPPDYTMVILNDLLNPSEPLYPCIKKGNETPPPEYGKEKQFFK